MFLVRSLNQVVDDRFLTQIRDTAYIDLEIERDGKSEKKYVEGNGLIITESDIKEIQEALLSLITEIGVKIRDNYES